jgi:cytochrome c oxidase subunit 2
MGSVQLLVAILFLVGTVGVVAVMTIVARHGGGPALPYVEVARPGYAIRRVWLWVVVGVLGASVAASLFFLPYPGFARVSHAVPVSVIGRQFSWQLSATRFRVGESVDFAVTSADVNHGFGVYDPNGVLIAQVQAMPGYVNHLNVTFDTPGTYTVRCMEYCGNAHYIMQITFVVTRK